MFFKKKPDDNQAPKILVSGNENYGLAQALNKKFSDGFFASRSSGWDLTKADILHKFAEETLKYSVYISCSSLHSFNQVRLLEKVATRWKQEDHEGRIIVIGSSADTPVRATHWIYPIEKKALKAYCRNIGNLCLGFEDRAPMKFRLTYLSVGHLNTPKANEKHPKADKLDLDYVVSVIEWLTKQPFNVNIHDISIDPIHNSHRI